MQVKTTDGLPHEMQIGTSFNSRECHGSIYCVPNTDCTLQIHKWVVCYIPAAAAAAVGAID